MINDEYALDLVLEVMALALEDLDSVSVDLDLAMVSEDQGLA